MDQGFNDDELADIMNEIESLEQEFTEETVVEAKSEDASHPDEGEEEAQSEVTQEFANKSSEDIDRAHHEAHDDENVHAITSKHKNPNESGPWSPASMDFSIEGDMRMNMSFNISGKTVHLHVNEGAFEIELEGGMKFSIPVHEKSQKKAA